MLIKGKENDINHFNLAKKYFNLKPPDYMNSLKELNQISFLGQNISVIHLKVLCLLMLSKYEEIIEFFYLNKKFFDSIIDKNDNDEQKNEVRKIISLAFFNFNSKNKAKQICPGIKEEYDYQIQNFDFHYFPKKENYGRIDSLRINRKKIFTNIKQDLDKNMNIIIKQKKDKELMNISSIFVEDLFKQAKNGYNKKHLYQIEKNIEQDSNSSNANIYSRLKNEISDIDSIQKEDGNLITFDEKIKSIKSSMQNENENIKENKLLSHIIIYDKPKESHESFNNVFEKDNNDSSDDNNNNNEINIYDNTNANNSNNIHKENNKKNKNPNAPEGIPRKSCNVFSFVNPIEFTLSPGDASFNNYSNSLSEEIEDMKNINNKNLIKVEADGVQYIFVKNENYNDINNSYEEYINIDFSGLRNKTRKRTTKLKYSKSLKIGLNRNKYKNLEYFEKIDNESKATNKIRQSNWKKTSYYKTNYFLENK